MTEEPKPYSTSKLMPLLLCMVAAAVVAAVSLSISWAPVARHRVAGVIENILWLVPSVDRISEEMPDSDIGKIILMPQWLFVPAYTFFWFYCLAPWSLQMRQAAVLKSRTLTSENAPSVCHLPFCSSEYGCWETLE